MWYRTGIFAALLLAAFSLDAAVKLDVTGVESAVSDNVLGHLRLQTEACDAPKWKIRREFTAIDKEAAKGLRVYGYYRPIIEKKLSWKDDCWQAEVNIAPGPPVMVSAVDIVLEGDAAQDEAFTKLIADSQQLIGKQLHHKDYEKTKSSLVNLASERGYFSAKLVTSELRVYQQKQHAEIVLKLDSGARYRIGKIHYAEHPLDQQFIERIAKVKEGDAFTADTMIRLDRNLGDSGYFQRVDVNLLRDQQEDHQMPLEVDLFTKKRHAWKAGIGYSTDTGARVSGGYENRYINPRGHQFMTDLQLSQADSEWVSSYTIPGQDPHKEKFDFGLSLKHEDNDSYSSDSTTLSARHKIFHKRWIEDRTLELLYESFDISQQSDDVLMLVPGTRWQYKKVDNPLKVHKGYRFSIGLKGAVEGLVSDNSFVQGTTSAKGIYRFGQGGRITARGEIGLSWIDDFATMPTSLRFFAGGDNSVRGYEYESLGPVDSNGEVIGGNNLLTSSIEYEHPVKGDEWWLAGFVDAGNAFNLDSEGLDLKVGYGVGLRWFSPVGRIRFDFALPEEGSFSDYQIHFSFGADL